MSAFGGMSGHQILSVSIKKTSTATELNERSVVSVMSEVNLQRKTVDVFLENGVAAQQQSSRHTE